MNPVIPLEPICSLRTISPAAAASSACVRTLTLERRFLLPQGQVLLLASFRAYRWRPQLHRKTMNMKREGIFRLRAAAWH